jgi:heme exporter protein B
MSQGAAESTTDDRDLLSWGEQVGVLLQKDILIEMRTRELLVTSGFFALLVVVLSSLSYYLGPTLRGQVASGVIWLATAFAAVLSLGRSWQREREHGAFRGVMVSPVHPSAVFAAKALGLGLFLVAIECVVIPSSALFFSLDLLEVGAGLGVIVLVATPGIAAAATLFGVMTVRTKARDLILAVVLFPLLAPTLVTAILATRELFDGVAVGELWNYLVLMGTFDVVFITAGLGMFGTLTES